MLPASFGLAATQLNLFVSTLIASLLVQGSVSWLWYAYRLMQLPIGVFGVALATVSLPALSRAVVAGDMPGMKSTLSATLRLVFMLTLPAAVWLAVMSRPLVALLYEHGEFVVRDTEMTGGALVMYCLGLPAFAAVGVLTRTFYALGDTRTPVRASFAAVALNIVLNLLLVRPLGHLGLALATSATAMANFAQLALYLRRRIGLMEGRRLARTVTRVLAAALLGGGVCWIGLGILDDRWHGLLVLEAYTVVGGLVIGAGAMYLAMKLLRVEELSALDDLARAVGKKLK
jgi:putative peptidoglycan lipid II flippase